MGTKKGRRHEKRRPFRLTLHKLRAGNYIRLYLPGNGKQVGNVVLDCVKESIGIHIAIFVRKEVPHPEYGCPGNGRIG